MLPVTCIHWRYKSTAPTCADAAPINGSTPTQHPLSLTQQRHRQYTTPSRRQYTGTGSTLNTSTKVPTDQRRRQYTHSSTRVAETPRIADSYARTAPDTWRQGGRETEGQRGDKRGGSITCMFATRWCVGDEGDGNVTISRDGTVAAAAWWQPQHGGSRSMAAAAACTLALERAHACEGGPGVQRSTCRAVQVLLTASGLIYTLVQYLRPTVPAPHSTCAPQYLPYVPV